MKKLYSIEENQLLAMLLQVGPFARDPSSKSCSDGCCGVFHPAMIADCSEEDSEVKVRGLARLLVRGLRANSGDVIPLPGSGG